MVDNYQYLYMSSVFRSGSALLSRMINAHPEISVTDDKLKFFLFSYERNIPLTEVKVQDILKEARYRLQHRWGISIDIEWCYRNIISKGISYASIHNTLTQSIFFQSNSKILGEMEVVSWRNIDDFFEINPKGKAIMIVRDLRDVVCSFKKSTIAPGEDYLIALFNVIDSIDYFIKYQKQYPQSFLGIKYEELKENPKKEAEKICAFLGVEFDNRMLDPQNWTDDVEGKWKNTQVSSFYDTNDHINPVGRWRHIISKEDLFLCEWIGREQMAKFNIQCEGEEVSQDVFDFAMKKILSSNLLRSAFKNWASTGSGMQQYPINPIRPSNWDVKEILAPNSFKL